MCMIDDCESWAAWDSHDRRARVQHTCRECDRHIQPGEQYQDLRALYDGSWETWKTCRHCLRAGEWLDLVCGGWLHGGLLEELSEHADDYPGFWIRLAVSGIGSGWGTLGYDRRLGRIHQPEKLWCRLGRIKWWKLGVPGLAAQVASESTRARARFYREVWA